MDKNEIDDPYLNPPPVEDDLSRMRPATPQPLSHDALIAGATFVFEHADRLSAADAAFTRGMCALLREGRKLTPRQETKLIVLTASLL